MSRKKPAKRKPWVRAWKAPKLTVTYVPPDVGVRAYEHRGIKPPTSSSKEMMVVLGNQAVAALAYQEVGTLAVFTHLVTEPSAPLRVRHRAVRLLLRTVQGYGAVTGRACLSVASKGVARFMKRSGCTAVSEGALVHIPGEL